MLRILVTAVGVVVLAACQDPVVDVAVQVPATPRPYAALVASMSVTVLAPTDPAIDCDAIAFGKLDPDAIALSQVTGVTFQGAANQAPITGVPRLGPKLWLAEGRDADGNLVVAGCTPQGDIDQDTSVTIATEPASAITLAPQAADQPVPAALDVTVDDGLVPPDPTPGRALEWDVYGPGGEHDSGDATVDAQGATTLALPVPQHGGPVSIQVRARWARTQPAVLPAFESIPPVSLSINRTCSGDALGLLTVDTDAWRAMHVAGHDAIAGLAKDATRTSLYVAGWDGSSATDGCTADLGGVPTFTILRASPDDPVDRLLVLTANQWQEYDVSPPFTITPRAPVGWVNLTGVAPVAVVTVPACGTDDGSNDYVLAQLDDGKVRAFDRTGASITSGFADELTVAIAAVKQQIGLAPQLSRGGCIAQAPGDPLLQAVTIETPRINDATVLPRFLAIDTGSGVFLQVPSYGAIAFGGGSDPLFLGGTLDPSGAKVVRYRLTQGESGYSLREVARADSLGPPASLAVGTIDGDDQLDTVWGLVDAVQGGSPDARIELDLGCGAGTLPLDGVSPTIATGAAAVFLAAGAPNRADLMIGGARAAVFVDTDLAP